MFTPGSETNIYRNEYTSELEKQEGAMQAQAKGKYADTEMNFYGCGPVEKIRTLMLWWSRKWRL